MTDLGFRRIAIVNRGEPAMRLIRAVRDLRLEADHDLSTVALYTRPDRDSLFVREADEAYSLGPALAELPDGRRQSSYLDYGRLERALVETQADAAWVGWGFVAEHADFADLCERMGVVFIGPSGEVMRRLGDKIASKRLAENASVPVAPWSNGPVGDLHEARAQATRIGYPLVVKAAAGGGGRGIRRVDRADQLEQAFESARSEALKAFGDGTVFLEACVQRARHVEVQIIADSQGTVWPVGVRDCSLQRRHQKVLEEAPCPLLDAPVEAELCAAAGRLAEVAGYRNAGTAEFLFEPERGRFAFMEMNTRLQVEHPVTEATTGLDLVRLQLLVAAGRPLEGDPPKTVGHAIEVRLNAEDPDNQFAPSPGRLALMRLPSGPGLRVDAGFGEGDEIPADFDSMVAKLIATGRDRGEALARLRRALSECAVVVEEGATNRAFLIDLLAQSEVAEGAYDIGWLDDFARARETRRRPNADIAVLQAAVEAYEAELTAERAAFLRSASRGRPVVRTEVGHAAELRCDGHTYPCHVCKLSASLYRVHLEAGPVTLTIERRGPHERWLTCQGTRFHVLVQRQGVDFRIEVDGVSHRVCRDDGGAIRASAPAVVLSVDVRAGDRVAVGQRVVLLEAMKMELWVTAPTAGRVREVLVRPNAQVAAGAPLLVLEPEGEAAAETTTRPTGFTHDPPAVVDTDDVQRVVARCRAIHRDLAVLLAGYDLSEKEIKGLTRELSAYASHATDGGALWSSEERLTTMFTDIVALFSREPIDETGPSWESHVHAWVRTLDDPARDLAAPFESRLRRALGHFGVEELDPGPALEDAALRLHKANLRAAEMVPMLSGTLERWLARADAERSRASRDSMRHLLGRLLEATRDRFPVLQDLAQQVQFHAFDLPLIEQSRTRTYERLEAAMWRLVHDPEGARRQKLVDLVVTSPHPVVGFLSRWMDDEDRRVQRLVLELQVRRFYGAHSVDEVETFEADDGCTYLTASVSSSDARTRLVAGLAPWENLERAIAGVARQTPEPAAGEQVIWDFFVSCSPRNGSAPPTQGAALRAQLARHIEGHPAVSRIARACFCLMSTRTRADSYVTFEPRDGAVGEVARYRGMHPMWAERLQLWRLDDFEIEPLPAAEDVYLYRAQARSNPRDERLFAFVDVRDTTPRNGRAELPHLEHMFLEALDSIRAFQYRRPPHRRLQWNRVVLYLWQPIEITPDGLSEIFDRLAPAGRNLGLEKVVVRARLTTGEDGDPSPERHLHIAFGPERVGRLRIGDSSPNPVRTLTPYQQRVVRLRARGLVYPWEIVRWLTPEAEENRFLFPPGRFTELDLDEAGDLVAVDRPYGQHQANVIVGIIRNFTDRIPEGMTRIMILGDPSREMGALAEPECRRIIAALDMAERMGVPVEWFPISAGAKISTESGTENLDWTARVLRRIIEVTQRGGEINVVVTGVNVGAQSYWNAEATMLSHTRGVLIMTPNASMVLTGKRALDYSGGVSAEDNRGIGGVDRIMGPNGQAQYVARDATEACLILLRHYEHTYVVPGERFPRPAVTTDPVDRDIRSEPHPAGAGGFGAVGHVFDAATNPQRKKPFDIRAVMASVSDRDHPPLERWAPMRDAEVAVVWDVHLGGYPVCLLGIESQPVSRFGVVPADGPEAWNGGTLFPLASKKVARAINAASDNRPVVILANLSGFDGSPESMRRLQLEYGAEIGRAVVNFDGPLVFCVISRYHGGAYVVFSRTLNRDLEVAAIEGSYASVIGGAPAAAVVLSREVDERVYADPRVRHLQRLSATATEEHKPQLLAELEAVVAQVRDEKLGQVADEFDAIHSVERALNVGSIDRIIAPENLRPYLIGAVSRGIDRILDRLGLEAPDPRPASSGNGSAP